MYTLAFALPNLTRLAAKHRGWTASQICSAVGETPEQAPTLEPTKCQVERRHSAGIDRASVLPASVCQQLPLLDGFFSTYPGRFPCWHCLAWCTAAPSVACFEVASLPVEPRSLILLALALNATLPNPMPGVAALSARLRRHCSRGVQCHHEPCSALPSTCTVEAGGLQSAPARYMENPVAAAALKFLSPRDNRCRPQLLCSIVSLFPGGRPSQRKCLEGHNLETVCAYPGRYQAGSVCLLCRQRAVRYHQGGGGDVASDHTLRRGLAARRPDLASRWSG